MTTPNCPDCGATMRLRQSRRGPFYGCSTFPKCRAIVDAAGEGNGKRKRTVLAWSDLQEDVFEFLTNGEGHGFVEAVAGAAKTTTIIEGMWRIRELQPDAKVLFLAFNKSIAEELSAKVPEGVRATTLHSYGLSCIRNATQGGCEIVKDKAGLILTELHPGKMTEAKLVRGVASKLLSLAKGYLAEDEQRITAIAAHHAIEGVTETVVALVLRALAACRSSAQADFDDMIWLPSALDIPGQPFDLVLVDEAQDLNEAQIDLVRRAIAPDHGRMLAVGDRRQAIYGFRGADSAAVDKIISDFDCITMPLSITYRCPTSIVEIAQRIVPQIQAAPGAPRGTVETEVYPEAIQTTAEDGDMILCRTNAPLVSHCLRLIRQGRKATIQGRDIGKGLISLIKRLRAHNLADLEDKLFNWREREATRILRRAHTDQAAERQIDSLDDKVDTIMAFIDGAATVTEVIDRIQRVFNDMTGGVKFSSVHRAKGLEADTVWILEPEKMPHPMATKGWELVQEFNIAYVAVTRAKQTLRICGLLTF